VTGAVVTGAVVTGAVVTGAVVTGAVVTGGVVVGLVVVAMLGDVVVAEDAGAAGVVGALDDVGSGTSMTVDSAAVEGGATSGGGSSAHEVSAKTARTSVIDFGNVFTLDPMRRSAVVGPGGRERHRVLVSRFATKVESDDDRSTVSARRSFR
jgi:hypothetical protein